ncbi:nitrite reductase (NAD(P)H) small subunit [Raineyella sp. LH-20]|uniref:nitrite reductase (NAD(P)H) small subunit n=1 Tax=Raineyella sp. LH-20 TaxID=3081204 RepID=UPI0029556C5B|nr:nitrite reductase (NAD(P)H) small subunit [Raineyella sp. LH-20]WOP19419.1 nitrite reductase (NAD(P)H) small subunit [Raineyella sp. LH-20]
MTQTLIPDTTGTVDWRRICRVADLEPGFGEAALVDGRQVALFLVDGGVHAVGHVDPATGAGVIARGITGSARIDGADRPTVASPLHKQVYDLTTGRCLSGGHGVGDSALALPVHPTRVVDGWIEVSLAA